MNISVPLPPHLEQFVRDQLASGCFQDEGDVIRAAMRLLEEQAGRQSGRESTGSLSEPITKQFWHELRERLHTRLLPESTGGRAARRSPRGMMADLRSDLSAAEIRDARAEMWSGFHHGQA